MIVSTILLAWSAAFGQHQQGWFDTLFPTPTGKNGLEDYVRAMDLMDQGYWSAYSEWRPPERRSEIVQLKQIAQHLSDPSHPAPDPKLVELEQRLQGLNMLQVRGEEIAAFSRSLSLISSGNEKPCFDPTLSKGVRVPSATVFPALRQLETDAAYVEASRSHTDLMIEDLTRVLVMVDHSCRTSYFGSRIATIAQIGVCATFGENLDRLSVQDCLAIESLVNSFLRGTPVFVDGFRAALLNSQEEVASSIHALKAGGFDATTDKQVAAFNQVINQMSTADVDQMIKRVQQGIEANARTLLSQFTGPEQAWLPADAPDLSQTPDPVVRTPDDIESYYTKHWSLPEVSKPKRLAEALKARAMMRLLRLHAMITAYRWQYGRLPKSLSEMKMPEGYDFDPLSKMRFVYEPSSDAYKLYSIGSQWTGKVELGVASDSSPNVDRADP
jgi:hypothetical protein